METASFISDLALEPALQSASFDHDIAEIAIGFGRRFGVPQDFGAATSGTATSGTATFGAATLGGITFRRVDPLREPFAVADRRLQSRLESLCETLRAKY